VLHVDIRIPGCPPSPQAIAEHLLAGLDELASA
jgi:coenzyme F420-reducing hydrogenase gamma subunit